MAVLATVLSAPLSASEGNGAPSGAKRWVVHGDARVRLESDWDSSTASGDRRDDRTRLRSRLRAGFRLDLDEHWRVEARLRTGSRDSQQSSHVTLVDFDGNDTGDADVDADRWFLEGRAGGFRAWAGRNGLPTWKQNEFLIDDDVTVLGIGLVWTGSLGSGELTLQGGHFSPPVGMRRFSGRLSVAQASYAADIGGAHVTGALGLHRFEADPDDPDAALLLQGNGLRDYSIRSLGLQARWTVGGRPLVVGADVHHNGEDYTADAPDPFTVANRDRTDGHVLQAIYGSLAQRGEWLVGVYRVRLETLAVNNSYAQDDWVRWGTATQTRGSDLEGYELRFGWAFNARLNVVLRAYHVDALTSVEDGKRARLDVNVRF